MILKPRYQVFTASSGEEVLALLPGLRPDLIFMDVKMPRMDGVQLLERVKAVDPHLEVVMITAYASLDTVQRAMRFGAMDYLVKPFAPRELQEAAERALARRRQRAEAPAAEPAAASRSTSSKTSDTTPPNHSSPNPSSHRRLFQIRDGAMISGVCLGLSEYLHIDVTIIRILFVVFALASSGWGILAYGVLMFVLPRVETRAEAAGGTATRSS